jgi:flagellar hook-associated protein 3 FlgL
MQTVFGQIDRLTDQLGTDLLNAANSENPQILDGLVRESAQRFDAVLAALNTKAGDKTLFAGTATDGAAVASADVILSALESAIAGAGATSSADIDAAVSEWFSDPGGFATIGYLGNDGAAALSISAEDKVSLGITAADPALRDTLKSLAMLALVDRGMVISDAITGREVVRRAATSLLQNDSDRAALAGGLGYAQARIEQAQIRNEAESSALQLARSDLLAVDPYEAATRMEAAQTQLETLYSVTARLSRLSLVDFLG